MDEQRAKLEKMEKTNSALNDTVQEIAKKLQDLQEQMAKLQASEFWIVRKGWLTQKVLNLIFIHLIFLNAEPAEPPTPTKFPIGKPRNFWMNFPLFPFQKVSLKQISLFVNCRIWKRAARLQLPHAAT